MRSFIFLAICINDYDMLVPSLADVSKNPIPYVSANYFP